MKCCKRFIMTITVVAICMFSAILSVAAEEPMEVVLQKWLAEVFQYNQETGFLSAWSQQDQKTMLEIMQKYNIIPHDNEWTIAEEALSAAFAWAYGNGRQWTYEQVHEWDKARVYLGLSNQLYYILPSEQTYSQEEALQLALEKISKTDYADEIGVSNLISTKGYDLVTRYIQYDDGAAWWFQFYLSDDALPFISANVWNNGVVTVDYTDKYSIDYVYTSWRAARDTLKFTYWSLEDKAAFYNVVLTLWERELSIYGSLPAIAQIVLEHEHAVPSAGMITENEARFIADQYAQTLITTAETTQVVFHYALSEDLCAYEIWYIDAGEIVLRILINAFTGNIIN